MSVRPGEVPRHRQRARALQRGLHRPLQGSRPHRQERWPLQRDRTLERDGRTAPGGRTLRPAVSLLRSKTCTGSRRGRAGTRARGAPRGSCVLDVVPGCRPVHRGYAGSRSSGDGRNSERRRVALGLSPPVDRPSASALSPRIHDELCSRAGSGLRFPWDDLSHLEVVVSGGAGRSPGQCRERACPERQGTEGHSRAWKTWARG